MVEALTHPDLAGSPGETPHVEGGAHAGHRLHPGQGRFVHPLRRQTLTPHEAARVQFFPDFFRFGDLKPSALQEAIGNAALCRLAFVVVLELLRRCVRE